MIDLVVLTGCKRAGKDTAAHALIERGWVRIALADPVKEMCLAINPLIDGDTRVADLVETVGWEMAKTHTEVRRLLQRIGTEGGRQILGENTWIRLALKKASECTERGEKVVVTDARFENEVLAFQEWGGVSLQIVRPGCNPDGHASEQPIDPYWIDVVIENTGTVQDLHQKVLAAVGEV